MTQFLPPNLLALFSAREPVQYLPPLGKLPHEKKNRGYVGVSDFIRYFEDPKDTPEPIKYETRQERRDRRKRERAEQIAYKLEQEIAVWDPHNLPPTNATGDAFKTLFVARINYDTSESKLRREFETYGPIKRIILVHDPKGKPKGYAFIEYEHERDMHSAYKHADGKKIDGRRVLVDVERGRTVKGWLPRRLGGGLGGTRRGGADVNLKHSGREDNERERERYRLEMEQQAAAASGGGRDRKRPGGDRDRGDRGDRDRDRMDRGGGGLDDRPRRRLNRSRSPVAKRRRSPSRSRSPMRHRWRDGDTASPVGSAIKKEKRRRSRSPRERHRRERERAERHRERDRDRERKEKIRVKTEPPDDYPQFNGSENAAEMTEIVKVEKRERGATPPPPPAVAF